MAGRLTRCAVREQPAHTEFKRRLADIRKKSPTPDPRTIHLPYLSDLRSLTFHSGGLRLQDSNIDEQLSALGQVPSNLSELVSRFVSDRPLTLVEVDALLANLTEGRDLPAPAGSVRAAAFAGLGTTAAAVLAAASAAVSNAAFTPPPLTESPLTASAAPLFDSRPSPPSAPPPVFETRSASLPPDSDLSSVFDDKPEAEATAQAIEAAFDAPESASALEDAPDPLESLAGVVRELAQESSIPAASGRSGRRDDLRGARRPDLDELLDQPLDALDFERTEPVNDDEPNAEARSEAPTGAPPPPASGDDFEILVDDEILEIAEDDVEMVDDEGSN
jgi:hypothetical protein